jgi:hypothetical protein
MYGGTSWALSPERASANMKMGKNLGQNTRRHRYITVPDTSEGETAVPSGELLRAD